MPIRRLQGLRGLEGLNTLSPEERDAFMKANTSKLDIYRNPMKRRQAANILYMNQKYINTFGLDDFNLNNDGTEEAFNLRNERMRTKLVTDAFKNTFGKDDNFNELATYLDVDGMYDLLNNQDYLTTSELRKKYTTSLDAAKRVGKTYDKVMQNPYVDALGQSFMQIGKQSAAQTPLDILNKDKERDKEILDKLKAESQKRREDAVQGDTDMIYANMLQADSDGKQSLAKTIKDFDALATKNSNYYKTFKNSSWMKDYSDEDKLKDYAKYQALKAKYGNTVALAYLERSMQNKVAEAQDGKFTGNTLKGVLTTAWSDIGSNVALFANMGSMMNADRMAILNQGKDPDKPIYDKKGNIVDYKENTNIWTNPAYWNNVYKYNTFSPTEIKAIEERGGVSQDVNVRQYGSTPDFLSWDTVEEGFKQGGHVLAGIAETALTGSMGKAIGWGGKAALKGLGLSAKAMQTASKVGTITNDILVGATTGLEGSQLEAMGTFDDQLQSAREKINAEIERELTNYQHSIDYNSKYAKAAINNYYNQLKAKDKRRVAVGNAVEGSRAFPLSDETLRAQAKQLYTNQLLGAKQKELQELHKKDEMEAARDAAKAYGTNFIMDYIKNIPLTTGIQKYKIAKGAMRSTFDNTIKDNIIADATTGGVKRVFNKVWNKEKKKFVEDPGNVKRYTSGKQLAKEMTKQLGAGFADEYLDGINASFSSGIGNNEFDNYIQKNYDPKAYNSTVDTMLGNMLAGLSEGINGLTDRENLYEGFIGMLSPAATAMVNPNAVFHPKDTWKALVKGTDANGEKISKVERISSIFMNPLLSSISEAKEKDKALDRTVDAVNKVVAAHKDKINDASKIISVLDNYDGPIKPNSVLDYKDNKLYNAFTLINALNSLEGMDGGTNSKIYQDTMHTIDGLANGTLTKEEMDNEIDMALADKDNKSILEDSNARDEAAKRLQKNAQYFMQMKNKMAEVDESFAKSPNLMKEDPALLSVLKYNIVASDDYKNRLQEIEDGLGINHSNTESLFTPNYSLRYGTERAKNRAIAAREREINNVEKEINKLQDNSNDAEKKIKDLRRQQSNDDNALEIKKQQALLDSYKFQLKTLEESKQKLSNEKDEIAKLDMKNGVPTSSFSENDILNSDVRDMAYILDENNADNFSEGRRQIIDSVRSSLLQKDPEALEKIKDASALATRIEEAKTAYSRIMNNKELATTYLDSASYVRERDAIAESVQKEIKNHYGRIESAYISRNEEPEVFRNEILSTNSDLIKAYMDDHPNQADVIKPYYDMLKFDEDAASILRNSDSSMEEKQAMLTTILGLQNQSNSREELESKIEGIIDSTDVDENTKEKFNSLLSKMEQIGYQRDSTILENRKQRKEREEAEQKKKEEEENKKQEEAKKAANKKVEEDANVSKAGTTTDGKGEVPVENGVLDSVSDDTYDFDDEGEHQGDKDYARFNELTSPYKDFDSGSYVWKSNQKDFKSGDLVRLSKDYSEDPDEKGKYEKDRYYYYVVDDVYPDGSMTGRRVSGDRNGTNVFNDNVTTTKVVLNKDNKTHYEKAIKKEGKHVTTKEKNLIPFDKALSIAPSDYEIVTDEQEDKKNKVFNANSLEKIDGDWYFNGTFAGDNKQTQVKASKEFDIDKAIGEQQEDRKGELATQEVDMHNHNVIDNGDSVQGVSPSIEQQASEVDVDGKDVQVSEATTDVDNLNSIGESNIETNVTTLSGNAMSRYDMSSLAGDGKIVLKKGRDSRKAMDNYYAWMDAAGIKLQNIIDHELARIIKLNPHAKVKFLIVNPLHNATHDDYMRNHLLLVLDYDSKINKGITFIHDDANGGVIDFNGKKYLTIGVAGYGANNPSMRKSWYRIWNRNTSDRTPSPIRDLGLVIPARAKYLKEHPNDRFYVAEDYTTEIVPTSQIPGYIVRQAEGDESVGYRSVKELLADDKRNPMHYDFKDLAWGIQELTQFLVVGSSLNNVMVPRNNIRNSGSAFVLMPASNGKMVPSYLKPLMYTEMKDGTLKDKVESLLQSIVSPDYKTRLDAIMQLSNIFYFDKDHDFILLSKNKPVVSLTHEGKVFRTFVLNSDFDRGEFMKAIEEMNPRVNITAKVLSNQDLLNEYDEAGALTTDAAMFGTAGSSYSIYALDEEGKMMMPEIPDNHIPKSDNSDFKNGDRSQVVFKQDYYIYQESDGNFYHKGKIVTDEKDIVQLQYNKKVIDDGLAPVSSKGVWDNYILSAGDNPEVIKINRNTKEVKRLTKEQAETLIRKLEEEKNKKSREEKAQEVMKKTIAEGKADLENVDIMEDDGLEIDPDTGEIVQKDAQPKQNGEESLNETKEENKEEPPVNTDASNDGNFYKSLENPGNKEHKPDTQSFQNLMQNKDYRLRIRKTIKSKWKDSPSKSKDLERFLKDKNIEVNSIGTSKEDIEAWIKTIEDCR